MEKLPLTLSIPEARELQDKIIKRVVELRNTPPALYDDRAELQRLRGKVSSEIFYKADSHAQELTLDLTDREIDTLEKFLDFEMSRAPNMMLNDINAVLWDTKNALRERK